MALDGLLRGSLADDADSPSQAEASLPTPGSGGISDALSAADTATTKIDKALAVSEARGEEVYAKARAASETLGGIQRELTTLKPPEYKAQPPAPTPKHTDPIEAFGSVASLAAIFGSMMTRQPLTAALNNAAGVMEAYQTRDKERAASEFALWKTNVENADTLFKFQNDQYQNALKNLETRGSTALNEVKVLSSAFDDQQMKMLAEQGRIKDLIDLSNKRSTLHRQLAGATSKAEDFNNRYNLYLQAAEDAQTDLGRELLPQEQMNLYNEYMLKPPAAERGGMTLNQAIDNARQEYKATYGEDQFDFRAWERAHPGQKVPEYQSFEKQWLAKHGHGSGNEKGSEKAGEIELPAPRSLPAQVTNQPEGTTWTSGGYRWEKRRGKAIAIERLGKLQ